MYGWILSYRTSCTHWSEHAEQKPKSGCEHNKAVNNILQQWQVWCVWQATFWAQSYS